jgi:maintenance of morphology protein 1
MSLGESVPKLSQARVNYSEHGRLRVEVDVEWHDVMVLSLDTQVYLCWPVDQFASLPVRLSVFLQRIKCTLAVELASSQWMQQELQSMEDPSLEQPPKSADAVDACCVYALVSCLHHLDVEFDVKSVLGHRTKLQDLSTVSQLMNQYLQMALEDELLWPNFKAIRIPLLPQGT